MIPALEIIRLDYPRELEVGWKDSCNMLLSSRASKYLKEILRGKVARRPGGTRRFFGEAFVATKIDHIEGYYGSFQWLTNQAFLGERPFPRGLTEKFQKEYRSALQKHFPGKLQPLQERSRTIKQKTGVTPAAPDLWLVEPSGRHRFIEVKLPNDTVEDNQLAGLALIAACLSRSHDISVQIIELNPSWQQTFSEFVNQGQSVDAIPVSESERMQIVWLESDELSEGAGHGIDFHTIRDGRPADLIAVLRDFEWLHQHPTSVSVSIRHPDALFDAARLAAARLLIEEYIRRGKAVQGQLGQTLYAHING